MKTEFIEIEVPLLAGHKYTGKYRIAQDGEIFMSAYGDIVIQAGGPSPAKVLILEEIK